MSIEIRDMVSADYDEAVALWRATAGFVIRSVADSRDGIDRLLARNPGLSVVARQDGALVGTVLASHDGRRGYLQHVVVAEALRGQGLANRMVAGCLERLASLHLEWVHLDVAVGNDGAMAFWRKAGWAPREELTRLSRRLL
jgi:ribosomal protein S18 acetylase RimI-like enzyme